MNLINSERILLTKIISQFIFVERMFSMSQCGTLHFAPVAQLVEHHIGNVEVCSPILHVGYENLKIFGEYIQELNMGSKKKGAVEIIALQCTECKRKNYTTYKNRKNITGKLEKNKYCPWCKKSVLHKETKAK